MMESDGVRPGEPGPRTRPRHEDLLAEGLIWIAFACLGAAVFLGLKGGSAHHLTAAGVGLLCSGTYLWLGRGRGWRSARLGKVALGCSVAWLVAVTWLAVAVAYMIRDFR